MNRAVLLAAVLIAVVAAIGAAWWVLMRPPAGGLETATPHQPLQPFRQVWLEGDADVTFVQGESEAIAIDAGGRSIVHAAVEDNVLLISAGDVRRWWSFIFGGMRRPPRIVVTFRSLDAVRASGTVRLVADKLRTDALSLRFSGAAKVQIGALEAKTLAINGSGAFKAEIAGRVDEQRISISGAGDYHALDLVSDRASITVSGAGRVAVNAQKTLDADVMGAAKVDYKGDPKVTQRTSGAARVRRLDGERAMRVADFRLVSLSATKACPSVSRRA
jgi:hypothetical protein